MMKMHALVLLLVLLAAAATTSARAKELSPFIRRNLVQKAEYGPARSHYIGRPRRLADGDCSADPTVCGAGTQCCGTICVNMNSDQNNCGKCRYQCSASLGCCAGKCVNLQLDRRNCGSCGSSCGSVACSMGFCGYGG